MEQEVKQDKILICTEHSCGKEFVFEIGEQEWYASRKPVAFDPPKRCKACRDRRKKQKLERPQSEHFTGKPPKNSWKDNRKGREGVYDGEKIQRY